MHKKSLEGVKDYFNNTVLNQVQASDSNRLWLSGVGTMLNSKMNMDLIHEDINIFESYLPRGTVLDFGTGSGIIALILATEHFPVKAVDVDNSIDYGSTQYNSMMAEDQIKLWQSFTNRHDNLDFTHYKDYLPFEDCSFDAVMAYAVIEHVPVTVVPKVLMEIKRVLRPGGILFISRLPRTLSFSEYLAKKLKLGSHDKLYADKEAFDVLTKNGFKIIERSFQEVIPAYPETITNLLFPILKVINILMLLTPLKYISHHLRFVCKKV